MTMETKFRRREIHSKLVTVGTSLTTVLELTDTVLHQDFFLQLSNGGASALNAFQVQVRQLDSSAWLPYLTAYSAGGVIKHLVGAPATLANGATSTVWIQIPRPRGLRLQASVASGTAALTAIGALV
jgi:hypothetical protein